MVVVLITIISSLFIGCSPKSLEDESSTVEQTKEEQEVAIMKLSSPVFQHNGNIPSKYTCYGEDISPPLRISGVPDGAVSLVLIMDDPDAQPVAGKTWDHWIVFNIPPTMTEIAEGQEPPGVHGKGTGGNLEYHGPCPPNKPPHGYIFKLYALDRTLDLREGATKAEVEATMKEHILQQTQLIGMFQKP